MAAALFAGLMNLAGAAQAGLAIHKSESETQVGTEARTALGITVYNNGQALVRDTRRLELTAGNNRIAFREVASTIRPETATLKAVTGAGFSLIEQNFDFDLLTPNTLLKKYVGREVTVIHTNAATGNETAEKATVLATNDGVVLRYADRIESGVSGRIAYGAVPANLRDRPTLSIALNAPETGSQTAELMYLANNVSWKADYAATLDAEGKNMNLAGWITLTNLSGTAFENARLQLIAGNLNTVQARPMMKRAIVFDAVAAPAPAPMPAEEKLFEYHLYTIETPTTVRDNQTKQLALLSADQVPVKRQIVLQQSGGFWWYQGAHADIQKGLKPSVFIEFENKEPMLGKPLPSGTVRVYKRDSRGGAQLIGEDAIQHTAKNEKLSLRMGEAFDITADRVQTDYKSLSQRSSQSSYRIELRNADKDAAVVTVREPLSGDWTITQESARHTKESAGTASWQIKVPGEGKAVLEYTAVVKW